MESQNQRSGIIENYLYKDERNNISRIVKKEKKNSKFAKLDYLKLGKIEEFYSLICKK